jgi:ParB family chromosome partitioning protein
VENNWNNNQYDSEAYIAKLDIDHIHPNPYQPRIEIKPESLVELADSIRSSGIIEPLIVTKKGDNRYEIIAGERRWRAAKLAKLTTVPVLVKEASPLQMLQLAIIENIHRQDLNPIEEALAFEQLMTLFNLGQQQIAKIIGSSRPAVANKIRLLTLPDVVKKYLLEGEISEGHARAILGLNSGEAMIAAAKIVMRDKLSVRQVEELVRRLNEGVPKKYRTPDSEILDTHTRTLENSLQKKFGTSVKLSRSSKGGRIVIPFKDDEELKRIYDAII